MCFSDLRASSFLLSMSLSELRQRAGGGVGILAEPAHRDKAAMNGAQIDPGTVTLPGARHMLLRDSNLKKGPGLAQIGGLEAFSEGRINFGESRMVWIPLLRIEAIHTYASS